MLCQGYNCPKFPTQLEGIFECLAGNFFAGAGNLQGILLMSMIGDGRTDDFGSQSARWVLRPTLGKSSDRGEPECFRPARTLREAPERGRLLLREPNAALLLGPQQCDLT
jgi:hypothetical protein